MDARGHQYFSQTRVSLKVKSIAVQSIFNRIVIRRIGRQGLRRNAIAMDDQKRLGRGAGVITSAIVDQKQMVRGLSQDHLSERLVTFRMKPTLNALRAETPREIFHRAKDLRLSRFKLTRLLTL